MGDPFFVVAVKEAGSGHSIYALVFATAAGYQDSHLAWAYRYLLFFHMLLLSCTVYFVLTVCYIQTLPDRDMSVMTLKTENDFRKLCDQLVDFCCEVVPELGNFTLLEQTDVTFLPASI
jgi:hypothetical protein